VRIGSLGQLEHFLDKELGWRKRELTSLWFAVAGATETMKRVLCRAAVMLLYAHWEGFVKAAGKAYVQLVARQGLPLAELSPNFIALGVRRRILDAGAARKMAPHIQLVELFVKGLNETARFSWKDSIKTRANLTAKNLRDVLDTLGLDYTPYELKAKPVIDRLVHARNGIAHGNGLPIDEQDYRQLHNGIIELLDTLRSQISDAAARHLYRRSAA